MFEGHLNLGHKVKMHVFDYKTIHHTTKMLPHTQCIKSALRTARVMVAKVMAAHADQRQKRAYKAAEATEAECDAR